MKNKNEVYITGSGFTKAFFENAPLLKDCYEIDKERFKNFSCAKNILESEIKRNQSESECHQGKVKINVERMMTRLEGYMPYDSDDIKLGLDFLKDEIKNTFIEKIRKGKLCSKEECHEKEFEDFARHCLDNRIDCVTFNNDDFFDEAIYKINPVIHPKEGESYWDPDGGYGFRCRHAESVISRDRTWIGSPSIFLLKLHGSINWRIKLGHYPPYSIDAIVHYEKWNPVKIQGNIIEDEIIESHLEREPLVILPVIIKSDLREQSILKHTWQLAYKKLKNADIVTFIGYSLPDTDMASRFLFSEAIKSNCDIIIIDRKEDKDEQKIFRERYCKLFPNLKDDQFDFRGALEWSRDIINANNQNR